MCEDSDAHPVILLVDGKEFAMSREEFPQVVETIGDDPVTASRVRSALLEIREGIENAH